jgi:hypothetical protein
MLFTIVMLIWCGLTEHTWSYCQKKLGAAIADAFRPICLQNSCVKILAKILTTRLQEEMIAMIDIDQTGFLKGRSISENFVYATELVQVCYKRKVPTIVLKLDFAKAFDTVIWAGLLQIMLGGSLNNGVAGSNRY